MENNFLRINIQLRVKPNYFLPIFKNFVQFDLYFVRKPKAQEWKPPNLIIPGHVDIIRT